VAPEPFGDGVRDLGECSGRGLKKSVARTYGYSGRTWTPLILPVLGGGGVERKAGWPGFPHNGKERARTRGESVMAGVPSQWEGTGRDKGEKGNGRGSLTMGRNGPEQREKAGWPGFPHNGKERGRERSRSRSRSRRLYREQDWNRNRNELCRLCAVLMLSRSRDGGAARGRRLAAVAVGELCSARSPGIVGRKKYGFRGGFGGRG
jgi:hypothetical protein